MQSSLQIALKEWAVVCQALGAGRQMILLRKGGIFEAAGGFELEHRQFLFFPTYLHQKTEMLKNEAMQWYERKTAEPDRVTLSLAGEVTDIIQLKNRAQMDALDTEHIWTSPLIDMRFNYRPQNPLYLLLVRAYRLAEPLTINNTPTYAGCKSWVPLENQIDIARAIPVHDEGEHAPHHRRIIEILSSVS